ncbi:endolytic transglycosylase MltG [Arthrobacter sp. NA-172]|uniref:endolytic transglycosylase MltG n=1 Tax=Arthrobacter sp. NA-172 TaxID=3367524 RepID=UPI0037551A1B
MSPVNNDPSNDASEDHTRGLTRREIRARERYLETQNQEILPPPVPVHVEPVAAPKPQPAYVPYDAPAAPAPEVRGSAAAPEAPAPAAELPDNSIHADDLHEEEVQHPGPAHPETVHFDALHPDAEHVDAVHVDAVHDDAVLPYDAEHGDEFHVLHPDEAYEHHDLHFGDEVHDDHAAHAVLAAEIPVRKGPSKKVRRRRRLVALLLTLAVFVVAVAVGAQFLKPLLGMDKVSDYPGPGTGSVTVTVAPGSGPKLVATNLQNQHVIANADSFLAAFTAAGGELSPGDFTFRTEMNNSDAVNVLLGKDSSKVMYFALSAGLRIGDSLDAISKGSGIPLADLKALSDSPAQFGVPAPAKNLEGFLAPGEYRFPLGTSAKDILQKLVTSTTDELKAQGVTDPAKQYQTITIASIVQAEGGQADYGNVAGAIFNRLKPGNTETNGLIQSDATVTYGLGTKTFHLTDAQKADKSNPYNTYANVGLPVGPIGSPGKTAIDAAAKPTANNYLYWVTINLDTKETKFSSTLAEHLKYVDQYNAWCAANAGRCV